MRTFQNFAIMVAPPTLFAGILLWSGGMGFADDFLQFYGFLVFFVSLVLLVCAGFLLGGDGLALLGIISALLFCASIFGFACFMDTVPLIPSSPVFGWMALPLMLGGGGGGAVRIIIIKIL